MTALAQHSALQPMLPRPFQVTKVRKETYDTFTLEMQAADGTKDFSFAPGQFNMLYVFGIGEVPISISGDPSQPENLVHTIRAVGTVTKAICALKKGDTIGVRGPFGTHWPVEEARGEDLIVAMGGIGLAPLRPALYQVLAQRERYGNITLLYGARTPRDILYRRQLERWRSHFDLETEVTVDSASTDWRGHVGVVTNLIPQAQFDPHHSVALVCGPEIMMRFAIEALLNRDLGEDQIYISMERNMKCAVGFCGHCQFGPTFICKDGPVFRYSQVKPFFAQREV